VWDGSELGDADTDASDDEIGGGLAGAQEEDLDGVFQSVRTKDEMVGLEADVAKGQSAGGAHGVEIGMGVPMRYERVVMAIDDNDGVRNQYGRHGKRLSRGNTHGHETLPVPAYDGTAGPKLIEDAGRERDHFRTGTQRDTGRICRDSLRDERDMVDAAAKSIGGGFLVARRAVGEKVFQAERLGCKDAINGGEAEFALAVKKVGNV